MIYFGVSAVFLFIAFGIGFYFYANHQKIGQSPYRFLNKNQLMAECKKRGLAVNWWIADRMTCLRALMKDDIEKGKQQPQTPRPFEFQGSGSNRESREEPEEVAECPACGSLIPNMAKFCLQCGRKMG